MDLQEMSNTQLGGEQIKLKQEHESIKLKIDKLIGEMLSVEEKFKEIQLEINKRNGK